MAFASTTVWKLDTGGDDPNNGGGFDPGNANMLTNGAATSANTSAPVFTSASYNFVAGDVGAWIYIKSGTNWTAGWYKIVSVAANAATLNGTIGQGVIAASGTPTTIVGCATTASPTSATWSIDYSLQAAAQFTYTDLVIDATTNTKATSAAFPFGQQQVGNIISVTSGTGFTVQRVQIVSVTAAAATMDKSLGTLSSTGGNGRLGGAMATPGLVSSLLVANNWVWQNDGTYTLTSTTANISGGRVSTAVANILWVGYASVPGDDGTKPVIHAGTLTSFTIFNFGSDACTTRNLTAHGNDKASVVGFKRSAGNGSVLSRCLAQNCPGGGIYLAGRMMAENCRATVCARGFEFVNDSVAIHCLADANTSCGFYIRSGSHAIHCVARGNSGGDGGFMLETQNASAWYCISDGNAAGFQNGFGTNDIGHYMAYNCIASNNTGWGFKSNHTTAKAVAFKCGTHNNTSGTFSGVSCENPITLAADPYVNRAGNDFALNNTAGGGALLRGLAYPSTDPAGTTSNYQDVGAFQHPSPTVPAIADVRTGTQYGIGGTEFTGTLSPVRTKTQFGT